MRSGRQSSTSRTRTTSPSSSPSRTLGEVGAVVRGDARVEAVDAGAPGESIQRHEAVGLLPRVDVDVMRLMLLSLVSMARPPSRARRANSFKTHEKCFDKGVAHAHKNLEWALLKAREIDKEAATRDAERAKLQHLHTMELTHEEALVTLRLNDVYDAGWDAGVAEPERRGAARAARGRFDLQCGLTQPRGDVPGGPDRPSRIEYRHGCRASRAQRGAP